MEGCLREAAHDLLERRSGVLEQRLCECVCVCVCVCMTERRREATKEVWGKEKKRESGFKGSSTESSSLHVPLSSTKQNPLAASLRVTPGNCAQRRREHEEVHLEKRPGQISDGNALQY